MGLVIIVVSLGTNNQFKLVEDFIININNPMYDISSSRKRPHSQHDRICDSTTQSRC